MQRASGASRRQLTALALAHAKRAGRLGSRALAGGHQVASWKSATRSRHWAGSGPAGAAATCVLACAIPSCSRAPAAATRAAQPAPLPLARMVPVTLHIKSQAAAGHTQCPAGHCGAGLIIVLRGWKMRHSRHRDSTISPPAALRMSAGDSTAPRLCKWGGLPLSEANQVAGATERGVLGRRFGRPRRLRLPIKSRGSRFDGDRTTPGSGARVAGANACARRSGSAASVIVASTAVRRLPRR